MFEVLSGCNVIGHGIFGSMASNYEPPQPPNYDNIEMEGMGTLTLPNSLKAPIDRLQLLGNSTQGCTIKVLSTELEHGTINAGNGENFPSNYRVRTKGFSDIQKGKYKVTCEGAKQANIIFYSTDGIYKNTLFKAHTVFPFYFTANEACKIRVAVSNGTEEEAIAIKPENVKSITVATEATPEYPQEIVSAGKYDEVSGKYVIDVGVTGKNLFDISKNPYKCDEEKICIPSKPLGEINITNGITFEEKTAYSLSWESYTITKPNSDWSPIFGVKYTDETNEEFYMHFYKSGTKTNANKTIGYVYIRNPWSVGTEVNRIQIEKGTKRTEYEPYHEPQTVKIQLDEPLRGIGQYKDIVTKDGILRKIKEIVLDENTGFETYWATLNKTFAFISPTIKDATVINGTPNRLLCNYSKALPDGFDRTDEEVCVLFNRRFHIRFLKERNIDTVEKLKEWLKQNPIKVQYLLQEPVLEMIENSLENLHANDGTTIITVDSGEVETGIKLTYRKEK